MDGFEIKRFKILSDGPGRFVLVDEINDDPAPVYETYELADSEMARRIAETKET